MAQEAVDGTARRHRALLGPAVYEHEETMRRRAERKCRGDRCNAVITQVLGGSGALTVPKTQARRHVGGSISPVLPATRHMSPSLGLISGCVFGYPKQGVSLS